MEIQICNYYKKIGKNLILENVNLSMKGGHVYGFWGVNGSGKTMLMRAIAGLIRPSSGTVFVDGKVLGKDISFPAQMGIFLERPAFLDSYTGFDNLHLLAQINQRIDDIAISDSMKTLGLNPQDNRKYSKYSLGMKQKLGLAAAIMENPELILLDEPTNSLDESSIELLKTAIKKYRDGGSLLIISSHDRDFLYGISDEIYHVTAGRVEVKDGEEK